MQKGQKSEPLLNKAKELEKRYDWLGAVDFYERAFSLTSEEFLTAGELQEKIGYCFFRAAFQAETNEQFRSKMKLAVAAYEEAVELFEKVEEKVKQGKSNHAKAMIPYASFWLAIDPSKKKELMDEWWRLEIGALKAYEEVGDRVGFGMIYTNLAEGYLGLGHSLESEWSELERKIEKGIIYGEKAIEALSNIGNENALASAYIWTSYNCTMAVWFRVLKDKREEFGQKSINYSRHALKLSERTEDAFLLGHSNTNAGLGEWGYSVNPVSALTFFREALKYGIIANDSFLISLANVWMVFNNNHVVNLEDDPDKQREGFKKSVKFAQDAIHYARICVDYPFLQFAYCTYTWTNLNFASIETDLKAKRILLEEAVKMGRESFEDAEQWVQIHPSVLAHEAFSIFTLALYRLSETEMKVSEKRRLLEEASKHAEKVINIGQRLAPFAYWNASAVENTRALIQAALAKIESNQEKKKKLLENAVLFMENCFELIAKDLKGISPGWKIHFIGRYYYWFGGILEQLYLLAKDKNILDRAIKIYMNAAENYSKAELKNREAESYWQIAKIQDRLGDNLEAARSYESAAETYELAGEKIPQLKEFYQDYSLYMQAWSEIEQARHNHAREVYDQSRLHYEKAAKLHKSSKSWSYLTSNYLSWAQMEKAEDLSRKEESEKALQAFQQAFKLFGNAKRIIETEINGIETADEKNLAAKLIKASDNRRRYCKARISIEEAKIHDRKGENDLSSRSYGIAAETLKKLIEDMESEATRRELKLIMVLCKAWQKMVLAEERASPEIYLEASQLFGEAKEYSLTKKTSLLALGNSSFCKALAAGIRFQSTLNDAKYSEAKGHIRSAENCYLKAGFQNASEHAKATQRLFDAYLYINKAEGATNPEKSSKYYKMAEKVLQISARFFMRAKEPEKRTEVQRILITIKEERKLAVQLSDMLHTPSVTSTTASFTTPTPTNEESVGLEKFEHADVQANLIPVLSEVKVGENINLEIEFTNTGKNPALLVKVEEMIPEGFKLIQKPEIYRVEDNYLNMKGKRLLPLKTEEVKLILKPLNKGVFQLKPRVLYLDESGNSKSCEPKPAIVTVKELGIRGWLKGPTK